ncbi:MAG: YiiD C-terminal domain-containing protein, partial [Gemmatimonadota bacterium]
MSDSRLSTLLATEIPLAGRLGVTVVGTRDGALVLSAPLAFNRNHEGTAFGGSLNAVATLAGWSAVWLAVQEAGLDG